MTNLAIKQTAKDLWEYAKQQLPWVTPAVMQSSMIYGALAILVYAALGDYAEGARRMGAGIFQGLLDAVLLVYLMRRCLENDTTKSEILDLRLMGREWKVWLFQQMQILFYIPASIIMFLLPRIDQSNRILTMSLGVALILAGVLAIYLRIRFLFLGVVVADRQQGAWRKSWQLTQGMLLKLIMLAAIVLVPWLVVAGISRVFDVMLPETGFIVYVIHTALEMLEYFTWAIPLILMQLYLYPQLRSKMVEVPHSNA